MRRTSHALACLALCALSGCGGGEVVIPRYEDGSRPRATIRGLISPDGKGDFHLIDCASNVSFSLDKMHAGNQHFFERRVGELARRSSEPVTAELAGYVRKTRKGFHMDQPVLIYVASGRCVDFDDPGLDYN